MEPYYDDGQVTIYHGRWEDVLPTLGAFDLIFTSPPYNLGPDAKGSAWSRLASGYDAHADAMPADEYERWQQAFLAEAWEHTTDNGAIFYNHKPRVKGPRVWLPLSLIPADLPLRQIITWDRGTGFMRVPNFYTPSYEWVLVIARPAFRRAELSSFDLWRIPIVPNGSKAEHPAPFPVALPARAIETVAPTSVLDPYAGSGSTLVAAKRAGVRAVGIEQSERYCEVAAERCGGPIRPTDGSLFAAAAPTPRTEEATDD